MRSLDEAGNTVRNVSEKFMGVFRDIGGDALDELKSGVDKAWDEIKLGIDEGLKTASDGLSRGWEELSKSLERTKDNLLLRHEHHRGYDDDEDMAPRHAPKKKRKGGEKR